MYLLLYVVRVKMLGFFDSGFGGLTIMKSIARAFPSYDLIYLGDNARAPYGGRSEKTVYEYTCSAVEYLFKKGCRLVIVACNTASALALRRIQQEYLPLNHPGRRALGVVRPSAETIAERGWQSVGIMATEGVVSSGLYVREIEALAPSVRVFQQACPLLVPIIEAGEEDREGTDLIVRRYVSGLLSQESKIDAVLLACTHYPLIYDKIRRYMPERIELVAQGPMIVDKFREYLDRHAEIQSSLGHNGRRLFLSTDSSERFDRLGKKFYGNEVDSKRITIG